MSVSAEGAATKSGARRNRGIAAVTGVTGAVLLFLGVQVKPGDASFYVFTFALAVVWVIGSLLTARSRTFGSIREGKWLRDVGWGVAGGLVLLVVFLLGAGVVARIDFLASPVEALLAHARFGALPVVTAITIVNGVTEEIFFRGALHESIGGSTNRRLIGTTIVYTLVTGASGIPLLALAAMSMGLLAGWLRQRTGALLAPIVAHLTWSLGMLYLLQPTLDIWRAL
ncbi:CPBP family intramembrane glutamic endopeptidase [Tessaracoccus antarcticus]|uniref:CPBP family intramembrane metalloprotease n=1 Tax=Tessaracoccus antarcticus TaxID=2479848 RepID=A0A3M0GG30_9ACTN|nr:type II CAAX endopeptidase family protein [Tessaracoccus antarcticus]RMB61662.1 CPBP family intramembrane metalloprotease [Tessaracoccus antarcticus]